MFIIKSIMNIHIREDMNEQEKCAICHERNCNTITDCEHYFHSSCLEQWIIQRPNCPVCRTTINLESNEVELNLNSNINESESDDDETDMNSIRIDITNMMNVLLQEQIFFSRRENNRIRELNITTFEDNILTHNENLNLREQNLNLMIRLNNQQTEEEVNILRERVRILEEVNILRERVRILEEDINNSDSRSNRLSVININRSNRIDRLHRLLSIYEKMYEIFQREKDIYKLQYEELSLEMDELACENFNLLDENIELRIENHLYKQYYELNRRYNHIFL